MRLKPSHKKILEYLSKYGSVNTFRLSKDLRIDRSELINLVKELTNEGLTNFRSGTVTKGNRDIAELKAESKEAEKEKPISKPVPKITKKYSGLGKVETSEIATCNIPTSVRSKRAMQRSNASGTALAISECAQEHAPHFSAAVLDRKIEGLKEDIKNLQTQRNEMTQKLAKERALLCQIRKEKKETEKNLTEWEKSLKEREESIQKREESISVARKMFKRKKEKISKAKILKKDICKLEATLEDLKKKINIEKGKLGKLKEKEIKPKLISRKKKPKKKQAVEEFELEKEEPKLEEQRYGPIRLEEQKVRDISYPETITKPEVPMQSLEKTFEPFRQSLEEDRKVPISEPGDFEEHEEIKPTLKSKIKKIIEKIKVSKTETEKPKISPKWTEQLVTEISKEKIEDRFHNLIEQEISLLKQRRIGEARNIHLQIKDMISEVTNTDQRKTIIKDWNRVKEFY